MNKFCDACVTKCETTPDDRRDGGGRVRTFKPDPGEPCDFCPEQATSYATLTGPAPVVEAPPVEAEDEKPKKKPKKKR